MILETPQGSVQLRSLSNFRMDMEIDLGTRTGTPTAWITVSSVEEKIKLPFVFAALNRVFTRFDKLSRNSRRILGSDCPVDVERREGRRTSTPHISHSSCIPLHYSPRELDSQSYCIPHGITEIYGDPIIEIVIQNSNTDM